MYLPTVAFQTKIFFLSIGLGFLLGIVYDIFYILRITFFSRSKVALYIQDVSYLLICSFITFLYILSVSSGMVRIYVLVGEIMGWIIYYISAGYFVVNYVTKFIQKTKFYSKKTAITVSKPVAKVGRKCARQVRKSSSKMVGSNKKIIKRFKLGLKSRRNLLYNTVNMVDDVVSNEGNEGFG